MHLGKEFISKLLGRRTVMVAKPGKPPSVMEVSETARRPDPTRKSDPPSVPPRA
jgi:hypothetical protein